MPISNYQTPGVYVTQSGSSFVSVSNAALNICILADSTVSGYDTDTYVAVSGSLVGVLSTPLVNSGTITAYTSTITGTNGVNFSTTRCNSDGSTNPTGIYTAVYTTSGFSGAAISGTTTFNYQHSFGGYGTYTNYNAVSTAFGPAVSGTNVSSQASLASYLAFLNGAASVTVLPVARASSYNGITVGSVASTSDWSRALTTSNTGSDETYLNNQVGVDVVVPTYPFSTSAGVVTYSSDAVSTGITSYLSTQFNNGVYQRFFIGIDGTANNLTSTAVVAFATAFNNSRVSIAYPGSLTYNPGLNATTGLSNTLINIAGYYGAAALAGLFVGQPSVATPITNKQVFGFTAVPNQVSAVDSASIYQANGLCVIRQRRNGNMYVQQGLTTNTSNWLTQEISINAIGDVLADNIQAALVSSGLIGAPLTAQTFAGAQGIVQNQLISSVKTGLIQAYQNLTATTGNPNPTTIYITFQYAPTYPINYIDVTLSLNPNTGQLTTTGTLSSNYTTA